MDPKFWGPKAWYFIHSIALAYPEKPTELQKEKYKTFFLTLGDVLPCPVCQEHYKENVNETDLVHSLRSRKYLFNWTVNLHNKVNVLNDKSVLSHEEALQHMYNEKYSFDYKWIIIVFLVLLLIRKK
jgi:hypothetical protein